MRGRSALVAAAGVGLLVSFLTPSLAAEDAAAKPPVARKAAHTTSLHGDTLQDDYFWMREKTNPEVRAYLEAENAYTTAVMKPTEPLQEQLYKEMLGRIKETDLTVPYRDRGWFYYSRTEKGKSYPIYCRKKGSLDAPEEVMLDVNELARGEKFMAVSFRRVSDDGHLLAYGTDNTGFRDYRLHVRDLKTGKDLPDTADRVTSAAWAADNRTLFYATTDPAKRPFRLWRHALGADTKADAMLYEEKDEMFRVGVYRTRNGEYLFFPSNSLTTSELSLPEGQFAGVRLPGRGAPAPRRRVRGRAARGRLLHPHQRHGAEQAGRHGSRLGSAAGELEGAHRAPRRRDARGHRHLPQLRRHHREGGRVAPIEGPRFRDRKIHAHRVPGADLHGGARDQPRVRHAPSAVRVRVLHDASVGVRLRGRDEEADAPEAAGSARRLRPVLYVSERRYAKAADGTKIPLSIVYRKGFVADGRAPMLLGAYGSYGAPSDAYFNSNGVSLLDRGFVLVTAHIRGGGELGKKWHDQGRMLSKKNTFTDFIASAEQLIADKYTSKDRLAIEGGSAGGLLMGAVTNMRPDLFRVVIAHVPFVDVINTMLDETVPLTVPEFEEWGNPKIAEQYAYMRSYSPYDNVAAKDYPTMLVKTSWDDSQVMYWEPAKYVAKLRAMKTDKNPLLFKINMAGGHGGSSGRYDRLRERAFDQAFLLTQLGVESPSAPAAK